MTSRRVGSHFPRARSAICCSKSGTNRSARLPAPASSDFGDREWTRTGTSIQVRYHRLHPLRRQMTRRTGRRDTGPELRLRKALHRRGLRFLVDVCPPGLNKRRRVDILLRGPRIAVFVDGCFWHSCTSGNEAARLDVTGIENNKPQVASFTWGECGVGGGT
ncbi:hypothetical protein [Actinopolyspora saharensis]|uniref:hypothetical protein n=1 Tax=Actinopolyspora saharensis TaxID=995062 RepID=UPI003182FEB6